MAKNNKIIIGRYASDKNEIDYLLDVHGHYKLFDSIDSAKEFLQEYYDENDLNNFMYLNYEIPIGQERLWYLLNCFIEYLVQIDNLGQTKLINDLIKHGCTKQELSQLGLTEE